MSVTNKPMTIIISSDTFGNGPKELGEVLLSNYIYTLTELEPLPKSIIFLNSGAYMTSTDSNALEDLRNLEAGGVHILTCGSCIDYYNLKDKLAVGQITNMFEITKEMATAENLVNI